ncbi:MAG: hypothetical protein RR232_02680 [Clostridia bacterium]
MEKRLTKGVYRVYDALSGVSFVGFSHNVDGTLKRLRFELTLNACSYRPLQQFCNSHKDFELEALEVYEPPEDMTSEEVDAHLKAMMFAWKTKLGETTQLIQLQIVL